MLSRPASRLAHAPSPFAAASTCALRSTAPTPFSTPSRPQHRRSSSKTSHPPGGPPPARGSAQSTSTPSSASQSREKRRSRSQSVDDAAQSSTLNASTDVPQNGSFARSKAFVNVPRVEPTDQLNLDSQFFTSIRRVTDPIANPMPPIDVHLFSLFALHRPIPINPAVAYPPSTSNKTFNEIFSPPKRSKIADEVYTMAFRASPQSVYANQEADGLHFSVLQSSDSNASAADDSIYLDGGPSLESLAKQYRPFQKPPAPVPLGDSSQPAEQDARPIAQPKASKQARRILQRRGDSDLANFFTPAHVPARTPPAPAAAARQSFLSRMEERGMANLHALAFRETHIHDALRQAEDDAADMAELENAMLLISVKRQRRLKMKKHKYKKLMRRTRNLRRREGRL